MPRLTRKALDGSRGSHEKGSCRADNVDSLKSPMSCSISTPVLKIRLTPGYIYLASYFLNFMIR